MKHSRRGTVQHERDNGGDDSQPRRQWAHRVVGSTLSTFAVLFVTRLVPSLPAAQGSYVSVDEVELTLTTLDRLLGLPATSLAWPATIVQFVTLPFHVVHHAFMGWGAGLDGFASAIGETYRAPAHSVFLQRLVSLSLFCAAATSWVPRLVGGGVPAPHAVALVAIGALQPLVWLHSFVGTGECMGMAFVLGAVRCAASKRAGALALAAFLMGLAIASRVTLAPCVVLLWCFVGERRLGWMLAAWVGAGFVVGCPSAWMEPVRLTKSLVGNLMRPGANGNEVVPWGLLGSVPLLSWLGACYVWASVLRGRWTTTLEERRLVFVTLGLVGSAGVIVLSGRQLEARYLLFLPLSLWVASLCFAPNLVAGWRRLTHAGRLGGVVAVGLLVLAQGPDFYRRHESRSHHLRATRELAALLDAERGKDSRRWAIDGRLFGAAIALVPGEQLDRIRRGLQARFSHEERKPGFAAARGVPLRLATVLADNFTEDERATLGRLRAAAVVEPREPVDVAFFGDAVPTSLSLDQAIGLLREGGVARLAVVDAPVSGLPLVARFGKPGEGEIFVHSWP